MTEEELRGLMALDALGVLGEPERRELDAASAQDPQLQAALEELRAVVAYLPERGGAAMEVPEGLEDRIVAAVAADLGQGVAAPAPVAAATGGRRRWAPALLAAAMGLLGAAAFAFVVISGLPPGPVAPVEGPGSPGLGVPELVVFEGDAEVDDGSVIAHTWGTEVVMAGLTGLAVGETYQVVVRTAEGEVIAGTLLGSEVPVNCRMNAAVLREQASAIEVRAPDGTTVVAATLT